MPSIIQSALPVIRPTQAWQGVQLFCTTRAGGVGEPPYDTLNLGLGTQDNHRHCYTHGSDFFQQLKAVHAWQHDV